MMFWLILLGVIVLIIYLSESKKPKQNTIEQQLNLRNKQWVDFITGYGRITQNAKERAFVQRMLDDIARQGLGDQVILEPTKAEKQARSPAVAAAVADMETAQTVPSEGEISDEPFVPQSADVASSVALDNISLLLYFGAFLFVASVGLFISFGGASGELRTLAVFLVSVVLYGGGVWLYHNRPKLEQAALAFVGIGIVIAPLIGAAAYIYVFNKSHGSAVWFVTSLFCLGMYIHALVTIRKPLLSYLLIFTFLSVFESGVSIMTVPVYYYGWGMAVVGILLQLVSKWKGYWPDLQEPSRQSSQIFLPIAVAASVVMTPQNGTLQLGVSLILAAIYYGLETLNSEGGSRENNAIVSQSTAIAAVAVLAYSTHHHWQDVSIALLSASAIQLVVLYVANKFGQLARNFASLMLVGVIAAILCAALFPGTLLITLGGMLLIATGVYIRQGRGDAYALATLAFAAIPLVYGQYYRSSYLSYEQQTIIGLVVTAILLGLYMWRLPRRTADHEVRVYADTSFIITAAATIITAFLASPAMCLIATSVIAGLLLVLAEYDKDYDWADAAGVVLMLAMVRSWNDHSAFLVSTLVTLAALMIMSLRYRRETMRWTSTIVWLFVPVAIGRAVGGWTTSEYAWAYMAAMVGLIFSRAIARGAVFVSAKIPLTSYARSASLSYVVGYCFAAFVAIGLSLNTENTRVQTSIILGILLLATWVLSRYIEKRQDILALMPILAQGLLISIVRPPNSGTYLTVWMVGSTVLAAACFWLADSLSHTSQKYADLKYVAQIALITMFITPAAVFVTGDITWPVALGLLSAGALTSYYVRSMDQAVREAAGGIISLAIMFFLYVVGIHELQAYIHVAVLTFGVYAYWRTQIGDKEATDTYLWLMLVSATVPLGLQALSGAGGGLYGWWLLLEQIAIMMIGMAIQKSFVTRWGLFVAIGAVLYQLRNLGYVALGVLAIVLIGIAIYQLQKHDDIK